MKINELLFKILLYLGVFAGRVSNRKQLDYFTSLFRNNKKVVQLIRVGSKNDGGYLVPDDLDGIKYCFSPGTSSMVEFEKSLAERYRIHSFMMDGSIERSPIEGEYFHFTSKYLTSRNTPNSSTLTTWVDQCVGEYDDDLMLQMDIEGGELDVLFETPVETLRRFRVMIIEFHDMVTIFERRSLMTLIKIFEKINELFYVVHMHPNNAVEFYSSKGVAVPNSFELTYLRKDRVGFSDFKNEKFDLPNILDAPNIPHKKDVVMPRCFWS